jgi:RHS repeat-associated protein
MTDATGQLVSESTFYPFGHPRNEHEPRNVKEAYGFTQKERDGESGLNYFEARYYLSGNATFLSPDPYKCVAFGSSVRFPQQLNLYSYCRRRPLVFIDPKGLTEETTQRLVNAISNAQAQHGNKPRGATECNLGTHQVIREMGAPPVSGAPANSGREAQANEMYDTLTAQAARPDGEYRQVSPAEAQQLANQGKLVIAAQKNLGTGSGHVSPVSPGSISPTSIRRFQAGNNPTIGNIGNDQPGSPACPNPNTASQRASCVFSRDESSMTDVSYFAPRESATSQSQGSGSPPSTQGGASSSSGQSGAAPAQPQPSSSAQQSN